MTALTFSIGELSRPSFTVDEPRWWGLGSWLTKDVRVNHRFALDALQMLDDVAERRSVGEIYEGDFHNVEFRPNGVVITSARDGSNPFDYGLDEVRDALEHYWAFMPTIPVNASVIRSYRPDLLPADADLLKWEETWKRPHPYRGRIGIPAEGPT